MADNNTVARPYAQAIFEVARENDALAELSASLDAARELLTPYVYGRDCPGRFGLLLAAVEFRAQDFARAQKSAEQVFECMTWSEREPYVGLRYLIHPDSVGVYNLLSDAQRDSLSQHYWWSRDPTPTSMVNERFVEQISRTVEANFYFSVPHIGKPGYRTDRGEVYQRYGPPDDMFTVLDSDWPAWTWSYGDDADPTEFHFTAGVDDKPWQNNEHGYRRSEGYHLYPPKRIEMDMLSADGLASAHAWVSRWRGVRDAV